MAKQNEKRSADIHVAVTPSERKRYERLADQVGFTLSQWLRAAARAYAREDGK